MAGPFKIGIEDDTGADLGFVLSCLALGMITMEELHQWIHHVIDHTPGGNVPPHLIALLGLQKPASVFRPNEAVMQRIPHDPFITDDRFDAILDQCRVCFTRSQRGRVFDYVGKARQVFCCFRQGTRSCFLFLVEQVILSTRFSFPLGWPELFPMFWKQCFPWIK